MKALGLLLAITLALWGCSSDDDDSPAGSAGSGGTASGTGHSGNGGVGGGNSGNGGQGMSAGSGAAGASGNGGNGASGSGNGGNGGTPSGACMDRTSNHTSGSRLRMKRVVTSEGDASWIDFHDNVLDLDCQIDRAADGMDRCLPIDFSYANFYFADAACSERVFAAQASCPPDYVLVGQPQNAADPCARQTMRVHELGAEYAAPAFTRVNGNCQPGAPEAGQKLYRLGNEHAPSEYAPVTREQWPGMGRLATVGYVGDGGFRQAIGFYDTMLGNECYYTELSDGLEHCASRDGSEAGYSDASCSEPLFSTSDVCGAGSPPKYGLHSVMSACNARSEVRELGSELMPSEIYYGDSTSCRASPGPMDDAVHYFASSAVSPDVLPLMEHTTNMADPGRLKPMYRTTADGGCWFDAWYDSQLDARCHFRSGGDGHYYCLPDGPIGGLKTVFNDAACTQQVFYVEFSACAALGVEHFVYEGALDRCETLRLPRRVTGPDLAAESLPALYTRDGAGGCVAFSAQPMARYFAVGEPLKLSEAMGGDVEIE